MTYDATTSSRQEGKPAELYLFVYSGLNGYYAYTDADEPLTFDAGDDRGEVTYTPLAVTRTAIRATGDYERANIDVTLPKTSEVALLWRIYPPSAPVALFIRSRELDDPDAETILTWSGQVMSCNREGIEAKMTCRALGAMLKRPGLRRNYQIMCPLALYSVGEGLCNADRAAATSVLTVAAAGVATNALTFESGLGSQHRDGGMVEWTTGDGILETRTIIAVSGQTAVLSGPTRGVAAGASVNVLKGCPHNKTGCAAIHSNINNYGGDWLIPQKNPFGSMNNFY